MRDFFLFPVLSVRWTSFEAKPPILDVSRSVSLTRVAATVSGRSGRRCSGNRGDHIGVGLGRQGEQALGEVHPIPLARRALESRRKAATQAPQRDNLH
jgi:hypothetical protein